MAQLAIKGHKVRGKEMIDTLEILGGNNLIGHIGYNTRGVYYINENNKNIITYSETKDARDCIIFTIEEFLKKFPYKVGDKVSSKYLKNYKIEKMEWEDTNNRVIYKLQGMGWYSADELQPYKEETMKERENSVIINTEHKQLKVHSLRFDKTQLMINDKYELKQEGDAYYIVRKKKQYPKTYEECCDVLGIRSDWHLTLELDTNATHDLYVTKEFDYVVKLESLRKLLICRDAYWKIAGEEMGLGESWKPNWLDTNTQKYCIYYVGDEIKKQPMLEVHHFLAFPTKEVRDAFYENFKDLIEQCKELL